MGAPKRCTNCGENPRLGGDTAKLGKGVDLCKDCFVASMRKGKCPVCGFAFKTQSHQTKCVQTAAA